MNTRKFFFGLLTVGILTMAACTSDNSEIYEQQSVDKRHITKSNKQSVDKRHITKSNKQSVDKRHITKSNKNSKNN